MTHTHTQDRVLHAVETLIASQLREGAKVKLHACFMGGTLDGPAPYAKISFITGWEQHRPQIDSPPIPLKGLVPEKAWPCASWIIEGMRLKYPEWFL